MEKGGKVALAWKGMECPSGERNAKERQSRLLLHHKQLEEKYKGAKVSEYTLIILFFSSK